MQRNIRESNSEAVSSSSTTYQTEYSELTTVESRALSELAATEMARKELDGAKKTSRVN
jgi:hypothetical protein